MVSTLSAFLIALTLADPLTGLIADDDSAWKTNTAILISALQGLQPGSKLIIPNNTYWINGGIYVQNLKNVTIQLDGTLIFQPSRSDWPLKSDGKSVQDCFTFYNFQQVTFTSSQKYGTLNGNGHYWWGYLLYSYYGKNRPRLFVMENSADILIQNWFFYNSPRFNVFIKDIINLQIRHSKVEARRNNEENHNFYNLGAFNTDGFDVAGKNVWIHDVEVWNQDDCVCVKALNKGDKRAQCSENMLFENLTASGLGLTIGSIGANENVNCVNNVTFRNIVMPDTFKGIYIKSNPSDKGSAVISNVLYSNITIQRPQQWGIWIGPQQAIYEGACSLAYPTLSNYCPIPPLVDFVNITLENVLIEDPQSSVYNLPGHPGIILSNSTNPIKNLKFVNVRSTGNEGYACEDTTVEISGTTSPIPCAQQIMVI